MAETWKCLVCGHVNLSKGQPSKQVLFEMKTIHDRDSGAHFAKCTECGFPQMVDE